DGDGRLVREELGGLEGLLNRHDLDEDECLTALELVPGLTSPPPPPAAGMMAPAAQPRAAREDPDLFVGPAGKLPAKVTERVMRAYDADKNLRLSPAEFAVGRATFDRLDRNGDGELTATELDRWREQPPDLEVSVALGNASQTEVTCRLPDGEREAPHPVRAVEATGRVTLLAGGQGVELNAVPGRGGNRPVRPAMDLQGLFNAAAGKDGFVRDTDLVGPQSQFLRIIFDGADRDADGRLTGPEFDAYFAVQQGFHDLPLVLRHMTRRPSLFQLLDGNDDGRLGVRELRAAWDRLRALEPEPGKGFGPEDLRAQGQIDIGTMGRVQQTAPRDVLAVRPRRAPAKGPTWFRKMDRNGDGDVSPSEWLGRPEHFARIDADADALISLAEAEAVSGAAARAEAAPPAAPRPPPAPPR
ncbi:MAG TPA: hypothetical protein VIL46_10765, partial [Gemmataceae bacterium]